MKIKFTNDEKSLVLKHWIGMPYDLVPKFKNRRLQYIDITQDDLNDLNGDLIQAAMLATEDNALALGRVFLSIIDQTPISEIPD